MNRVNTRNRDVDELDQGMIQLFLSDKTSGHNRRFHVKLKLPLKTLRYTHPSGWPRVQ